MLPPAQAEKQEWFVKRQKAASLFVKDGGSQKREVSEEM